MIIGGQVLNLILALLNHKKLSHIYKNNRFQY